MRSREKEKNTLDSDLNAGLNTCPRYYPQYHSMMNVSMPDLRIASCRLFGRAKRKMKIRIKIGMIKYLTARGKITRM